MLILRLGALLLVTLIRRLGAILRQRACRLALAALHRLHLLRSLRQAGADLIFLVNKGPSEYHGGYEERRGGGSEDIREHADKVAARRERQEGGDAARRGGRDEADLEDRGDEEAAGSPSDGCEDQQRLQQDVGEIYLVDTAQELDDR